MGKYKPSLPYTIEVPPVFERSLLCFIYVLFSLAYHLATCPTFFFSLSEGYSVFLINPSPMILRAILLDVVIIKIRFSLVFNVYN